MSFVVVVMVLIVMVAAWSSAVVCGVCGWVGVGVLAKLYVVGGGMCVVGGGAGVV